MMGVSMVQGVETVTSPAVPGGRGGPKFLASGRSLHSGKRQ
jgi:hypothetical protein